MQVVNKVAAAWPTASKCFFVFVFIFNKTLLSVLDMKNRFDSFVKQTNWQEFDKTAHGTHIEWPKG
jgi:hypothetical protein